MATKAEIEKKLDDTEGELEAARMKVEKLEEQLERNTLEVALPGPEGWRVRPGLAHLMDTAMRDFQEEEIGHKPVGACRQCDDAGDKPWNTCDRHKYIECDICGQKHTSALDHVDFVGHADATARALEMDPAWTWKPLALDERGLPVINRDGNEWEMWIVVTYHEYGEDGEILREIERLGIGTVKVGRNTKEPLKQLISDALRNAFMRSGVALDLWAKGDRTWNTEAANALAESEAPAPAPKPDASGLDMDQINTALEPASTKDRASIMRKIRQSDAWSEGSTAEVLELVDSIMKADEEVEAAAEKLKEAFQGEEEETKEKPKEEPAEDEEAEEDEEAGKLKAEIRKFYGRLPKEARPDVQTKLKEKNWWPLSKVPVDKLERVRDLVVAAFPEDEEPF